MSQILNKYFNIPNNNKKNVKKIHAKFSFISLNFVNNALLKIINVSLTFSLIFFP